MLSAHDWEAQGQQHMRQFNRAAAVNAFEQVLSLEPNHLRAMLGLAAAHLELQQHAQALPWLAQALAHPNIPPQGWQRTANHLVNAHANLGQVAPARGVLDQAVHRAGLSADTTTWIQDAKWRLQEGWWTPLVGKRLRLRRIGPADADWLKAAFAEPAFASAVHREYALRLGEVSASQLAQHLAHQLSRSPADLGGALWRVELLAQPGNATPLGLVSLVGIDAPQRHCEFIMGFPMSVPSAALTMEAAMLAAELAFSRLYMSQVQACIYADNPRQQHLQDMLARFCFFEHSVLRGHVLPGGQVTNLSQWRVRRTDYMNHPQAQRLYRRVLGRPWPPHEGLPASTMLSS